MKKISALLFLGQVLLLQGQNQISGKIIDVYQQAVPFANVLLLQSADSILVTGAISDETGIFKLETEREGSFLLNVSSLGYADLILGPYLLSGQTKIEMPNALVLKEDTQQLDEVELVARRNLFERQEDRTVVNVQSSAINTGASALGVIETAPGMTVNRVNGVVGMLGKEGTIIYINGKRTRMTGGALMQMLDGLPSSNIEKLELITNPPASYDAEGTAGIVNIIMKENAENEGYSGSFVTNGGYGDNVKYGGSGDVYYTGRRVGVFLSFANNNDFNEQPTFIDKRYELDGNRFFEDLDSARDAFTGLTQIRLGGSYTLTPKMEIGGEFKFRRNTWDLDAFSRTVGTENGQTLFTEDLISTEINNWNHYLASAYVDFKIGKKSSLGLVYDYLDYSNTNDATYSENRIQANVPATREFLSEAGTEVEFHVAKIDFDTPLGESSGLGFGVKGTVSNFTNAVSVFDVASGIPVPDEALSRIRNLDEDIWAAYGDLNLKISEKTDINAGLRFEYTDSQLTTIGEEASVILDRGQFFPSFRISHKPKRHWNMSLSYGERITRPNFTTLAPAFFFFNSSTIVTGNTAIRPVTSRSISYTLGHKRKQLTFQFTDENNPNAWLGTPNFSEDFSSVVLNPQPLDDRKLFTATVSFPIRFSKSLTANYTLSGLWQQEVPRIDNVPLPQTNWYANLNGNVQYEFSNALKADFSATWITPRILGLSQSDGAIGLNFGASCKISEQWQLAFSFRDILDRNSFLQFDSTLPNNNAGLDWIYQSEGNIGSLSLRYNFGGGTQIKERGYGSEDEQERVN